MQTAISVLLFLVAPTALLAQSPFAGTWRLKLDSVAVSGKPDSFLLANGKYKCNSCVELKAEIEADGQDHTVSGSKYIDSASVSVVDEHTVDITRKLKGKVVSEIKDTVSSDGKTLTSDETDYPPEGSPGQPSHQTTKYDRVARGPSGSHSLSGEWKQQAIQSASENAMTAIFEDIPNGLKMSDISAGEQWEAKFDGKTYPVMHDPGNTMVSLKRIDTNTVEETDTRDGKAVSKVLWKILPDGHTLKYSYHDERNGTNFTGLAQKQ